MRWPLPTSGCPAPAGRGAGGDSGRGGGQRGAGAGAGGTPAGHLGAWLQASGRRSEWGTQTEARLSLALE